MNKATWATAWLLACAATAAQAQAYRCGNTYSQQPCPGGSAVAAKQESPSTAEARERAALTRRDAKLGDAMEKERLAREKQQEGPTLHVVGQAQAAASAPDRKKSAKQPAHFSAVSPKAAPEKKKEPGKKS